MTINTKYENIDVVLFIYKKSKDSKIITYRNSSGQSGCLEGLASMNASCFVNSSLIREIMGNSLMSTLNLLVEREENEKTKKQAKTLQL